MARQRKVSAQSIIDPISLQKALFDLMHCLNRSLDLHRGLTIVMFIEP